MKQSKIIALCGISAAFGSICLVFLTIAPTGKLALFALSSVALMIPLSKKQYVYTFLTMLATAFIAYITGGLLVFLPYLLGFGVHPIINAMLSKYNVKYGIAIKLICKLIYFIIVLYILFTLAYLAKLFLVEIEFYILALLAAPLFIIYDYIMIALQKRIDYLIDRYIKFF